jgi:hypothetical protein
MCNLSGGCRDEYGPRGLFVEFARIRGHSSVVDFRSALGPSGSNKLPLAARIWGKRRANREGQSGYTIVRSAAFATVATVDCKCNFANRTTQ